MSALANEPYMKRTGHPWNCLPLTCCRGTRPSHSKGDISFVLAFSVFMEVVNMKLHKPPAEPAKIRAHRQNVKVNELAAVQ